MRFGSIQFRDGGVAKTSRRIQNHPSYNPRNLNNDISLVHVPSPLSFNSALNAIRLPRRAQEAVTTFDGKAATVSGWGATQNNGPGQAALRWTNVRIIPNAQCRRTFGLAIVAHVVCSVGSSGNQGVCGGDSGGPLVVIENGIRTQIGVVSFGAGRLLGGCAAGRPSAYMRTASYLTWINQHTGVAIRA